MTVKVLHIFSPNYAFEFGGAIVRWKFYSSQWSDPDVVHYVLDSSKNIILSLEEALNFKLPDIQRTTSRWKRFTWIFSIFRNLQRYESQYDILHVHKLWWGGLLIGPWAKLKKIPAIYESVLYGSDTPGGINRENLSGIKLACLKSYSTILTVSEYIAKDYLKSGFKDNQVVSLLNCVDTNSFFPVSSFEEKKKIRLALNIPRDAVVILFVGSIIRRKGVDLLVNSFLEVSNSCNKLYLLLVGPNNKNENPSIDIRFIERLELLLNKYQLKDQVRFTGLVQDKQMLSDYFRASDIFVFPTHREGLPNVLLEAMSSGLPIIVSEIPFLEGIITHNENALIVPIDDSAALQNEILLLINNISLRKRLGSHARNCILNNHSFDNWQSQIVKLYKMHNSEASCTC